MSSIARSLARKATIKTLARSLAEASVYLGFRPGDPFPASDDFSGVAPNSGSTTDANFTARWTSTIGAGSGSNSVSGGVLNQDVSGAGNTSNRVVLNGSHSGAFDEISVSNKINDAQPAGNVTLSQRLFIRQGGGNDTAILANLNGVGHPTPGWTWEVQVGGSAVASDTSYGTEITSMKWTRTDGSTLKAFINGVEVYSGTYASDVDALWLQTASIQHTGCDGEFDDFVALDGGGDPIYL